MHSRRSPHPAKMMKSSRFKGESLTEATVIAFRNLKIRTSAKAASPGNMQKQNSTTQIQMRNRKNFFCSHCGKGYVSKQTRRVHQRLHTESKPSFCKVYNEASRKCDILARHRKVRTGGKPYSCEECGKAFGSGTNLARHRLIHTGERPYSCRDCGATFNQRSNLVRHQLSFGHQETKLGPLKEERSALGGSSRKLVKRHRCSDCSASFLDEFQLCHHRYQWHEERQALGCTRCRTWFSCSLKLRRHLEIHTQGLRFQCGDCQQRFASRTLVRSHHCPQ